MITKVMYFKNQNNLWWCIGLRAKGPMKRDPKCPFPESHVGGFRDQHVHIKGNNELQAA